MREEIQEVKEESENLKITVENRTNEIMRLLSNIMNIINERMSMEKQSQELYHENNARTVSLQRLEKRINIHNRHDAYVIILLFEVYQHH